jgi:hypothetical protein
LPAVEVNFIFGWLQDYNGFVMRVSQISVLTSVVLVAGCLLAYSQQDIPKDLSITLERTRCFGWCPAYAVTITADGTMKFTPEGAFAIRGDGPMPSLPITGRVTADRLNDLLAEFRQIKFFSLQRRYGSAEKSNTGPSCPEYSTDSSSADVTIVINGKRKTVSHYLGCGGASILDRLVVLEDKIDDLANTQQWTSRFGWGVGSVVELRLSSDEIDNLSADKQVRVKTLAVDPENDVLTYQYTVSAGKIIGKGAEVIWDLRNLPNGTYTITAGVDDGCGICGATKTKSVTIK